MNSRHPIREKVKPSKSIDLDHLVSGRSLRLYMKVQLPKNVRGRLHGLQPQNAPWCTRVRAQSPRSITSARMMFTPSLAPRFQHSNRSKYAMDSEGFVSLEDIEANSSPAVPASMSESSESHDSKSSKEVEEYVPLTYQVPTELLADTLEAYQKGKDVFWSHDMYKGPDNKAVLVQYCKSKETCERVAQQFMDKKVIGFDIEWRPNARKGDGLKKNVSIVQIAAEERIALFHLALHKGTTAEEIVPPTLRTLLESPDILKAGVAIRGDCTRVKDHLEIETKGMIELSHLHNLVTHARDNPQLVKKGLVSLTKQVLAHFGLPLRKDKVRTSDWAAALSHDQARYAATDAYAGYRLFDILEQKRMAMNPVPPRPAPVEDNKPIIFEKQLDELEELEDDLEEIDALSKQSEEVLSNPGRTLTRAETAADVMRDIEGLDFDSDLDDNVEVVEVLDLSERSGAVNTTAGQPPELQTVDALVDLSADAVLALEAQAWAAMWGNANRSIIATLRLETPLCLYYLWHHHRLNISRARRALLTQDTPTQSEHLTDVRSANHAVLRIIDVADLPFATIRLLGCWLPLTPLEQGDYPNLVKRLRDLSAIRSDKEDLISTSTTCRMVPPLSRSAM